MGYLTKTQREMLTALPRDSRGYRPLHELEIENMQYNRDHCSHCGREYDTKWQLCPDEQCAEIYGD